MFLRILWQSVAHRSGLGKVTCGLEGRPFPWSDKIENGNADYYCSYYLFEKIAGGLGDTTPVGYYNGKTNDGYQTINSASPYGFYDMAGHVWQWTGDIYEGTHFARCELATECSMNPTFERGH